MKNLISLVFVSIFCLQGNVTSLADIPGLGYISHFENKHYWEHTQPVTQERAAMFCRDIGFELVEVDSVEEQTHLREKAGGYDYWTSGVSINNTSSFIWDLAWNEKNPIAVDIFDIPSESGIYFSRNTNTLRTTSVTTSMRPLCQHVKYGCSKL